MDVRVIICILTLVTHGICLCPAQDIRSKVDVPRSEPFSNRTIDPDKQAYGVPFGASESDFVKAHGKPWGYVRLNDRALVMFYGRARAIVFRDGKFAAVRNDEFSILDWKLMQELVVTHDALQDLGLNEDIVMGTNLERVRAVVGDKLMSAGNGLYHHYFTTTNARVDLNFSSSTDAGSPEKVYKLYGIYVQHGPSANGTIGLITKTPSAIQYSGANPLLRSAVDAFNRTASKMKRLVIDPDDHIYGVPLGASEDDFIKAYGPPDGYLNFGGDGSALLHGRSHAFVFRKGKLAGVRVADPILEWTLASEVEDKSPFQDRELALNNGIEIGMNRKQVSEILGKKLLSSMSSYHRYYDTKKSRVDLDFSHSTSEGSGEQAYKVSRIYISPVSASGTDFTRLGPSASANTPMRFGGIGVHLTNHGPELKISKVMPGLPAAKAGLKEGMVIRSVDDVSMARKDMHEARGVILGMEGTKVKLELFDPEKNKTEIVQLTRARMESPLTKTTGPSSSIPITTDKLLRVETRDGACAFIQFLGFTKGRHSDVGEVKDTATYRWRFKASPAAPVQSGTNTVTYRYTSKRTGENTYHSIPKDSLEAKLIKVDHIRFDWSYGYTNKGFLYIDRSTFNPTLRDASEFDDGP